MNTCALVSLRGHAGDSQALCSQKRLQKSKGETGAAVAWSVLVDLQP